MGDFNVVRGRRVGIFGGLLESPILFKECTIDSVCTWVQFVK